MENLDAVSDHTVKRFGTDEEVKCGTFWEKGPCIMYFMRRFGCQVCRAQAKGLSGLCHDIKAKKSGRLIIIGPELLGADEFAAANILDGEIFYDPEKKLYKDLQMKRYGSLTLMGSFFKKSTWDTVLESNKEGVGGNLKGDIYQLGGLFSVDKGGKLLYQFRQNEFADHADLALLAQSLGLSYKKPDVPDDKQPPQCSDESCVPPKV